MYLLTRPVPGIFLSQQAWQQAGLTVTCLGMVDITYNTNEVSRFGQTVNRQCPDIAIITSRYAVSAIKKLPHLSAIPRILAVGASTARALLSINVQAQSPLTPTSEGLLALPALEDAKNRQVAIIKGEAGRTTLHSTLIANGALVDEFTVYKRIEMKPPAQTNQWQWPDVKGIIATSEAMVEQLFNQYDTALLKQQPWLTVSQRVAETIRAFDIAEIGVASGASDEQLCRWIKENWE